MKKITRTQLSPIRFRMNKIYPVALLSLVLMPISTRTTNNEIEAEYFQLAKEYYDKGNMAKAVACYQAVLAINPTAPAVLYNTAYLLKNSGEYAQALPYYNKLLELNPAHSDARQGRSHALLALGNYEQAWEDFEHRWSKPRPDAKSFTTYMHTHNNDLSGKTVLLKAEFGFGDTFQFIRYAQLAKNCGARVIAEVQKQLIPLLSCCPYLDLVIPADSKAPAHDLETVLMSLPWAFKTTLETIPIKVPYLYADTPLVQHWHERLKADTNFKIGICWHGNAYTTQELKKLVDTKSIPLKLLASLARLKNVSIYSLQKTSGLDELASLPDGFVVHTFDTDFDDSHGAFMDTAAIMKNLDLIVTIDTSIVHLAGGLGVPTWLMLSYASDWRWLVDRTDSPWYPGMKLFRQEKLGDWHSVVQKMTTELQELLKQHNTRAPAPISEEKAPTPAQTASAQTSATNIVLEKIGSQELFEQAIHLYGAGKEQEALACYQELVKRHPNSEQIVYNYAFTLRKAGQPAQAITQYEKVLALNPAHPYARMGLGQCYLALEQFDKGFELFEDRWTKPRKDVPLFADYVRTHQDLTGKKLLLKIEWGFGDTFMILRYIKLLKERGATIIVESPQALVPILSQQPYIDQIFLVNTPPPAFDFSTVTLSLPWTFKTNLQNMSTEPSMTTDQKLVQLWHDKLKSDTTFKIGIVWKGTSPEFAIPVALLASLAQLDNVSVYALQKDSGKDLAAVPHYLVKQFDADFDVKNGPFMDSAAIMKNLDLVITVDTCTAHLAGALGVPVWTLLSYAPDWRWFTKREDCPWYPTMRLFRQPHKGDWDSVITRVKTELQKISEQNITRGAPATKNPATETTLTRAATIQTKTPVQNSPATTNRHTESNSNQSGAPLDINAIFSEGLSLVQQGDIEKALACFTRINEIRPTCVPVLFNIAGCYRRLGELETAANYYEKTRALDPKHTDAAFGLALVRHTQGDMKQGWELFNLWRTNIDQLPKNPDQLVGKKVLIKAEWGLGDMINFIRYAYHLKELNTQVFVQSHKALVKLLSRCPYIDQVIPHGTPLPATDFQLPLLYLPTLFKTTEQTVPNAVPYLYPDPQLVTNWHNKLAHDMNLKVGICWDMGHYDTNLAGWKRAAPLEFWHAILRTKNVSFYCLQKEQLEQLASLPADIHVTQFGPDFDTTNGGFMDSAAVIHNLDLVISVDTSIAHLAGALGIPVWMMLPYHTDYRWMRDRTDTPWYPRMKLFRSQAPDDWKPVTAAVARELQALVQKKKQ